MLKRALSLTLVLALCLSLGTSAFAADMATAGTTDVTGDSTVEEVTFRVVVPTSLDFAIDPFGLKAGTNGGTEQIYNSTDYYVINRTEVPVKVTYALEATLGATVNLVGDSASVFPDDDTKTDKDAYFAAIVASDVYDFAFSASSGIAAASPGDTDGTYNAATAGTILPFTGDATAGYTTGFAFALGAAEWGDAAGTAGTMASNKAGVAGFKFYAKLNTYADWEAGDLGVTGKVKLTALKESTYNGYELSDTAHQLIKGSAIVNPGNQNPVAATAISGSGLGNNTNDRLSISKTTTGEKAVINMGTYTIKSIAFTIGGGSGTLAANSYENKSDSKLYIKWGSGTTFASQNGLGRLDVEFNETGDKITVYINVS